jgi:WD40 repeat protein
VQFSPNGKRIITISQDRCARVWDTETGQAVTSPLKHAEDGWLVAGQFSSDGNRVLTLSATSARVWDARSGQLLMESWKYNGHRGVAQFSQDGKYIVTASGLGPNGRAQVWDALSGRTITEPLKHHWRVISAQFSPDGERIVTTAEDRTARVWDATSSQALTKPLEHNGWVNSAQFSPDGTRIVTGSGDSTARIWDVKSGQPLAGPLKHSGPIFSAQFSPDGKRVVTASEDETARVWDARSGEPLTEPVKHDDSVTSVQFSPDGKRIITVSKEGTVRVWDIPSAGPQCPEWLLRLCEAISGKVLTSQGVLEETKLNRGEVIKQIREKLSHEPDDDHRVVWGRWFLADPSTRTISPYSELTVPEYIENRMKENTFASLAEAEELAFGNPTLLARIAELRARLAPSPKGRAAKRTKQMKTAEQPPVVWAVRDKEITWLEAKIAQLEGKATASVSRQQPDTAHSMQKDYDDICEEIISLRRHLNDLRQG